MDQADEFIGFIESKNRVDNVGWWIFTHRNGTLAAHVAEARSRIAGPKRSRPPWCGQCDKRTRLRQHGIGLDARPYRCPDCHPDPDGTLRPPADPEPAGPRSSKPWRERMCKPCGAAGKMAAADACPVHQPEEDR